MILLGKRIPMLSADFMGQPSFFSLFVTTVFLLIHSMKIGIQVIEYISFSGVLPRIDRFLVGQQPLVVIQLLKDVPNP